MIPTIVTLTGPTCAGKSTLEKLLNGMGFVSVISTTTRAPRDGEVNGQHYYFVTPEAFQALDKEGKLVESICFDGNHYGVSVAEVERVTATGLPVVVVVEPAGRRQIQNYCHRAGWNCHSVYVGNPDGVIAKRFLMRFNADITYRSDKEKVVDRYASRMASMMTVEEAWKVEALNQHAIGIDKPYEAIYQTFDEANVDQVIRDICTAICHPVVKKVA